MKQTEQQRLLLLEQSGELSARQRLRLDKWRQQDAAASTSMTDELKWLKQSMAAPEAPSTAALQARIHQRLSAEEQTPRHSAFRPLVWPAVAAAAAILVLALAAVFTPRNLPPCADTAAISVPEEIEVAWVDPLASEFDEIESLIAAISLDEFLDTLDLEQKEWNLL